MGITGTFEGYYSGNGIIYNRGSWGSGYNIGWFSAYTSDSGSSFTQSSTSIKFNAASAPASNYGSFLFGNSNKTIVLNAFNTMTIKVLVDAASSYSNCGFGVEIYGTGKNMITRNSISTTSGTSVEYTLSINISSVNTNTYFLMEATHTGRNNTLAFHGFTLLSMMLS